MIDRLGDIPAGPELVVVESNRNAAAGTLNYGTTPLSQSVDKTFTITNSGTSDLTITSAVTITGPSALAFELVSGPVAGTVVAPGGTASFVVRLTAAYEGVKNATITFTTDDTDEGTVNLPITANVLNYRIIDDQNPVSGGYSDSGAWAQFAGPYYQGDASVANTDALQGPASASWTFANVTPGTYYAALTWFDTAGNTAYASNTPVSVWDGAASEGTFFLNQRSAPGSFAFDGVAWQFLVFFVVDDPDGGGPLTTTTVTVTMSNAGANGLILADAAIIARIGGAGEIPPGNSASGGFSGLQLSSPMAHSRTAQPVELSAGLDQALLGTAFWNDELEEVAVLLADYHARESHEGFEELVAAEAADDWDVAAPDLPDWLD
ncbi:MAG: choice-of-anchor D domain-containing protein [Planctomycetes bacterium]|nr:choice-of-anchor D domain-containing protein [Planctomycetota bacterium]